MDGACISPGLYKGLPLGFCEISVIREIRVVGIDESKVDNIISDKGHGGEQGWMLR